ncbi:MAG TPA: ABC transporter permease [Gaiellaceae bacterium]|nr:ABC transporter permease [Gaiellaceae bacterium]
MLAGSVAWAFLVRDVRIETSHKAGFAFRLFAALMGVPIFFFVARAVRGVGAVEGFGGYFAFVIVGLAATAYMSVGIGTFVGSLRRSQATGALELMVLSRTPFSLVLLFSSLPGYLLALLSFGGLIGMGAVLGMDVGQANIPLAVVSLVLATAAFVALGLLAASVIFVTSGGNPVSWVIRAASIVLAGIFYPVSVLPGALGAVAEVVPLTHAAELLRRSLLNGDGWADVRHELMALLAITAVLMPLGVAACRLTLRVARTDGSLSQR